MKFAKEFTLFLVFFLIFYFEPLYIIGIKFAVFWKFFLFLYLIFRYRKLLKPADNISKYGFLYTIKNLFNLSTIRFPLKNIYHTIVIFNFPFFYNLFRHHFKQKQLLHIIKRFSIFTIISSIPFHLHILEPLGIAYDINLFNKGLNDGNYGFVGIFQNAHGAAIITSFAVINLIFFYKQEKKNIYLFITALGIFNIYMTYVRTGYVLLAFGLLIILLLDTSFYQKFKAIFLIAITSLIFIYTANTEVLLDRLFNITKYNPSNTAINYDVESISSGRTLFWLVNLGKWWESDYFIKMFGFGEEVARDNMENTIGSRIFSHNGFIDSFIENGVIGVILFLSMFFYIYKLVINNKGSTFFSLAVSSAIMFFLMNIFQGGYFFLMDVLLALNLSLLLKDKNI